MIASPTDPPTWRSVWITPEASPRSLGGAVLSASVLVGLMTIPMPTPITRYPGTSQPYETWSSTAADQNRAAPTSAQPMVTMARGPIRS